MLTRIGTVLLALTQASCATLSASEMGENEASVAHIENGESVAGLPFSNGRSFASLDAYLAYLEQYNGPIDMPWWREISPSVYRYEIRMADGPEPEIATRAELEERYGFASRD